MTHEMNVDNETQTLEHQVRLEKIAIDLIDDHPDNPRLVFRDDVIDGIAANLKDGYHEKHAVHVRPIVDRYQLISGHHRKRAAEKANLPEIWAWVESLDDATAFMELVLSNNQGELSPLEIGMHALKAVPLAQGKKGEGLAEYAHKIGRLKQNVSLYRQAAEVVVALGTCHIDITSLLTKSQHLAEIATADAVLWPLLVMHMINGTDDKSWSVADTKHWVGKVKEFDAALDGADEELRGLFLDKTKVVNRFLDTHEFSPRTVAAVIARVKAIIAKMDATDEVLEEHISTFKEWLKNNAGGASWDTRKIEEYEREFFANLDLELVSLKKCWMCGDWRDHIKTLKDGSVTVLLTDPPYGMEYQSNYRLDTRQPCKQKKIEHDGKDESVAELAAMLASMLPKMADNSHVLVFCCWANEPEMRAAIALSGYSLRGSLVWVKNNTGMGDLKGSFAPKHERILHAVKGSPTLFVRTADVFEVDRVNTERHPTEKPVELLTDLITTCSTKGELIADPFGGVASTLVAAKNAERIFWGCELDAKYYSVGMQRLSEEM